MIKIKSLLFITTLLFTFSCSNNDSRSTEKVESASLIEGNEFSSNESIGAAANPANQVSVENEYITEDGEVAVEGKMTAALSEEVKKQKALSSKSPKAVKIKKEIPTPLPTKAPIDNNESVVKEKNSPLDIVEVEKTEKAKNPTVKAEEVIAKKASIFSHEAFDQLLKKYVSAKGAVNYSGFKSEESKLDTYLKSLEENPPTNDWSKNKKMAYWINLYNAATIKLILKNHPVSSITKLHGGKPWDVSWVKSGNKTYSLNNIENDILRPIYKDARIHFAVNCAAKSCPPLLNSAWTESNLSQNLEQQTRNFINNAKQNKITANSVEISKIFEWYAVDFGNIVDFLNKYANLKINSGAKVTYKEYNWDLNK
jgi:uncharacterized protein DUF547